MFCFEGKTFYSFRILVYSIPIFSNVSYDCEQGMKIHLTMRPGGRSLEILFIICCRKLFNIYLQSRTKFLTHFVFWRKFRVEIPPLPIATLNADENFIDELTNMSSLSNQHCTGETGSSAMENSSFHTGKASFDAEIICPNEFCPRL